MSDFFILALMEDDAPQFDIDQLYSSLNTTWNILNIQKRENADIDILSWDMKIDDEVITGHVDKDRKSLTLDGDLKSTAKFVVWLRKLISDKYTLSMFEASYIHDLMEIDNNTTEEQIFTDFWT